MATGTLNKSGEKVETLGDNGNGNTALVQRVENTELLTRADAMGLQVGALLQAIPEGGDDDLAFVRGILAADDLGGIDAPWRKLDGLKEYFGRGIRVWGVKRVPSEFEGGLGWFFVLDIEDILTGKQATVSTGSVNVMAQIMKVYALGVPQFECVAVEATKPTKDGYRPYHLEAIRPIPAEVIG